MQATREVRTRERETLMKLAKAGEYRDQETGNHIVRMSKYARLIAEELKLTAMECDEIEAAAPMHDIGKIGIPDHILLKPGKHTEEEQAIMRRHPVIGHEILAGSPSRYLKMGAIIALGHHEKFDGSGYPQGLAGESIPLAARIVAVADVFDALTSVRPYKAAWSFQQALDFVKTESGRHFDPACVSAFEMRIDSVAAIMRELRDSEAKRASMKSSPNLPGFAQRLAQRVRSRPDTEFQQSFIRVAIGLIFLAYFSSDLAGLPLDIRASVLIIAHCSPALPWRCRWLVVQSEYFRGTARGCHAARLFDLLLFAGAERRGRQPAAGGVSMGHVG